jgi:hypothetical protein
MGFGVFTLIPMWRSICLHLEHYSKKTISYFIFVNYWLVSSRVQNKPLFSPCGLVLTSLCIHVHCSSQIWTIYKMLVLILQKLKHFSLGNFNFIIRLCHVFGEYEHANHVFIFCFTICLYYCFEHLYVNIKGICIVDIWWIRKFFPSMLPLNLC